MKVILALREFERGWIETEKNAYTRLIRLETRLISNFVEKQRNMMGKDSSHLCIDPHKHQLENNACMTILTFEQRGQIRHQRTWI